MHLLAVRPELIEREPWLAAALADMYDQALGQCREYYDDPNYSMFPWSPYGPSHEADQLAAELWPSWLKNNRAGLERFIGYCHDQGLIHSPMRVENLFAEAALNG